MSGPHQEQWRKIFLDADLDPEAGQRFIPSRTSKGLSSAEHLARYLFAASFCAGKRVLDLACGSGYGSYILKILGAAQVVGVDSDAQAIELAHRNYQTPGIIFRTGDATALEMEDAPFDVVVAFEALEQVSDAEAFLESVRRQLDPDGLLIISCANDARSPSVSPFHVRHYTYQEFYDLVGRYFPGPRPISQIHAVASLILPPHAAAADDVSRIAIPETYIDVEKTVESSDVFLLLCGGAAADVRRLRSLPRTSPSSCKASMRR